jgi:hypothetical protein
MSVKHVMIRKFQVIQAVQTPRGARTMGTDPATHTLYLPTAELEPSAEGQSARVQNQDHS